MIITIQFLEEGKLDSYELRSWFDLIKIINHKMKDQKISFPLGEDDEIKTVIKRTKEIDKFT